MDNESENEHINSPNSSLEESEVEKNQ